MFHPADPIVVLYRPIDQLQKLSATAGILYSQAQQLEFGLTLVFNTRDFDKDIGEWSAKPDADKTWNNFKTHFKQAQTELKEIRGPKMHQTGYHHDNMLATQMQANLEIRNAQMLAKVQQYTDT